MVMGGGMVEGDSWWDSGCAMVLDVILDSVGIEECQSQPQKN